MPGVGQQRLPDLLGGGLGQRQQQRSGVLAPAGEVDGADGPAGDRVVDRHAGAGEVLEVLGVVLVAEHVRRAADLQRRADAVGADELLGVAEAGRELDPVEVALEVAVAGQPGQHQPGRVGEDDADRLPVELLAAGCAAPAARCGSAGCRGRGRGTYGISIWSAATLQVAGTAATRRGSASRTGPGSGASAVRKRSRLSATSCCAVGALVAGVGAPCQSLRWPRRPPSAARRRRPSRHDGAGRAAVECRTARARRTVSD